MAQLPETFYFAIMTSFDGRACGSLLGHQSWMYSSADAWCHWSSVQEEATIFKAEGTPDRFILEIYKSFKNRQGGIIVGRPTWVYNASNTCFNYTSVKNEATEFKLVSVDHGYILEILSSFKNRAKGTNVGQTTWMYNENRPHLDGVGAFGYTSVQREATVLSIHTSKDVDENPPRIVDLKFDMDSKTIQEKPYQLFSATYINKGDTPLTPTWTTENTKETKKTRSFRWNSSSTLTLGAKYSVSVKAPFVSESGEVSLEASQTYEVGKESAQANTETQKWSLSLPSTVPAHTSMKITASVTSGSLTVPFTATLQQDGKTWKETGVYESVQCFNLVVESTPEKV